MKTYFTSGNYSVVDFEDQSFAKYSITNVNRCFNDLDKAIVYAILCNRTGGEMSDNKMMFMVESLFIISDNK